MSKKSPYFTYNPETKVIYIYTQPADTIHEIQETLPLGHGIYADIDRDDKLIGVEILLRPDNNNNKDE